MILAMNAFWNFFEALFADHALCGQTNPYLS
jgi:hypothetical protein